MRTLLLSASSMDDFDTCMLKGHQSHNLRLRPIGEAPSYLDTGTMIHKMLEVYYTLKANCDPVAFAEKRGEIIDQAIEAGIFVATTELELPASAVQENVKVFNEYCEYYKDETWTPLKAEIPFTKILFEDPDFDDGTKDTGLRIAIHGKIDLLAEISGKKFVVDHKSGARRKEPHPLANQWRTYCWATDTDLVVVNQVGFQKTVQKFHRPSLSFTKHLIDEWVTETTQLAIKIHLANINGYYPRSYAGCERFFQHCQYTPLCAATSQASRENTQKSMFQVRPHSNLYEEDKEVENA